MAILSAPTQRALQNSGISTLKELSNYSEAQVMSLHGIGKTALIKLRLALKKEGLNFKN